MSALPASIVVRFASLAAHPIRSRLLKDVILVGAALVRLHPRRGQAHKQAGVIEESFTCLPSPGAVAAIAHKV